ncbi:hypothetical protein CHS0354_037699 [Potamilus streckersoni]|uniref:Uncharacterized protein n=1 Tax=Potamilus streckersoni TaxID=2493646 RepID=A0AAE0T0Y5_9BIVA|nr:hypothetical protein CHS0354_037699 [Potamilus streckersoni]
MKCNSVKERINMLFILKVSFRWPTVSAAGYVAFLPATLSSIIKSIGDYFAAASISYAPPPPAHAVNRGIAMEGFCSILSGMVGAAHATTSYSGNIGAIGITKNLTILGISLILGLMVPQCIHDPRNTGAIHTGNDELDQIIRMLLATAIFVGGFIACLLDNTVPGSPDERGLLAWRKNLVYSPQQLSEMSLKICEFPYVTRYLRKINCLSYFPLSPTFYKEINLNCCQRSEELDTLQYTFDNVVCVESMCELSNVVSTQF